MEKNIEDLYEILDELNAQIEDIVNEFNDTDGMEFVISKLNQKAQDFVFDFQQEVEKMDMIGAEI